jgi:hypothetical protein
VIRLLLFIGLMYLLYIVVSKPFNNLFGRPNRPKFTGSDSSPKKPPARSVEGAEEMIACTLCGTFISKWEGETRDGKFVCKPACHR